MKKIGLSFLKGLFVIFLLTSTSVALHTLGLNTVNTAAAAVSSTTVKRDLQNMGYYVYTVYPITGTNNWAAITRDRNGNYWITTVFYSPTNSLLGHENDTL